MYIHFGFVVLAHASVCSVWCAVLLPWYHYCNQGAHSTSRCVSAAGCMCYAHASMHAPLTLLLVVCALLLLWSSRNQMQDLGRMSARRQQQQQQQEAAAAGWIRTGMLVPPGTDGVTSVTQLVP